MNAIAVTPASGAVVGPTPDALTATLHDVMVAEGRLFSASIRHDAAALAMALEAARNALSITQNRRREIVEAMTPADDETIKIEVKRLVRSWPQERRGDLAGYGAELAILVLEQRPSRRAIETACRKLKLERVHLPAIAEVIAAIGTAEARLAAAVAAIDRLSTRIAAAEARLAAPLVPAPVDTSPNERAAAPERVEHRRAVLQRSGLRTRDSVPGRDDAVDGAVP